MARTVSIIIPFYNEEKTLANVIEKVLSISLPKWKKEVIAVNDGSDDRGGKIVKRFAKKVKIVTHRENYGKGRAVLSGLKKCSGDCILIQDADLEYDPREVQGLLKEYSPKVAVFGSRNLKPTRQGYKLFVLGDKFLSFLVNIFFGTKLTDVFSGYKLIPTHIFRSLDIKSKGFDFEMEVTVKLLKKGIPIKEIPIKYRPRNYKEGKKFTLGKALIVGLKSIGWIVKMNFPIET